MIIVIKREAGQDAIGLVLKELEELGLEGRVLDGLDRPIIHILNAPTWPAKRLARHPAVSALIPTSGPRHRREGRRFFPYHFLAWCNLLLLGLSLLLLLAGFFPPGLGRPADLLRPGENVAAPWYIQGIHSFLALFPAGSGGLAAMALALIWAAFFFLPEIDRTSGRAWRQRLPILALGLFALFGGLALTLGGTLQ